MKLYSDVLERRDLYAALPNQIHLNLKEIPNPRKRRHGYIVGLEFLGAKVKRDGRGHTNSGNWRRGTSLAATWDEWGIWMNRLFEQDPNAVIGNYDGLQDFIKQTAEMYERGRLRESLVKTPPLRCWTAPWLHEVEDRLNTIRVGTLHPDGTITNARVLNRASIATCPFFILVAAHYREDGTCRCDDPTHVEMDEWGYHWDESITSDQGRWVNPDALVGV